MVKYIQLDQGKETTVDDIDYRYLMQWEWFYHNGYAARPSNNEDGEWIYMHKIILERMLAKPRCSDCGKVEDGTCTCITEIFCIEKGHSIDCTVVEEYLDDDATDTEIYLKCTQVDECSDYANGHCHFLLGG